MGFRENLREAIELGGLRQKELAYKSKIGLRNIEGYLSEDATIPAADKAVKIAKALGVTVEYLVTGKEPEEEAVLIREPDLQKLIKCIRKLPPNKKQTVIQNFINLTEILSQQK